MSDLLQKYELEALFKEYYQALVRHSLYFVRQPEIAEEIVQEVFINIWEKRNTIAIHTSYKSYLYMAVRNKSIDYLKSKLVNLKFVGDELLLEEPDQSHSEDELEAKELHNIITQVMKNLPERCYLIFSMSRFGDYTNKQIAEELNISQRTVETQISIAIKRIKHDVGKYLVLLAFWFCM